MDCKKIIKSVRRIRAKCEIYSVKYAFYFPEVLLLKKITVNFSENESIVEEKTGFHK